MQPDTKLYVTDRGSILMPSGALAVPGNVVLAASFEKNRAALDELLAAGKLSLTPVQVTGIDVNRVDELPPALPNEINLKTGEGVPRSGSSAAANDGETLRVLKQIAEAKAAREKALAEVGPDSILTPDEAKALGLVK